MARRVIIIGGGAAGLMAAGQAASRGVDTLLLEKMRTPARKLRLTGKGRCNLTNNAPLPDFISHFGRNGRFLRQAFSRFFTSDLVEFFEHLGVPTVTERGGRIFPEGNQASAVAEALQRWAKQHGVRLKTTSSVKQLIIENKQVVGVQLNGSKIMDADAVIVATGGVSYPATGSTGDGYRLAEAVGHTIVPIRPALVPLETAGDVAVLLQDLSLRNVNVRIIIGSRKKVQAFGEMLFTHFGVSGPIILSLSGLVVDALRQKREVILSIDLKPALDEQKLDARLLRELTTHSRKRFKSTLRELLPAKLIPLVADLVDIPLDKPAHQITATERRRLRIWLKDFRLEVTGHRPIDEAIITAGGVDTREVDPPTMASRLVKNLYFAGEVLDINANTGGYNLQAAFSTGWLAGQAAAQPDNPSG